MAEELAFIGVADRRVIRELVDLTDVVHKCRGHQKTKGLTTRSEGANAGQCAWLDPVALRSATHPDSQREPPGRVDESHRVALRDVRERTCERHLEREVAETYLEPFAVQAAFGKFFGRDAQSKRSEPVALEHGSDHVLPVRHGGSERGRHERGGVDGVAERGRLDTTGQRSRGGSEDVPCVKGAEWLAEVDLGWVYRIGRLHTSGPLGRQDEYAVVRSDESCPAGRRDAQVLTSAAYTRVDDHQVNSFGKLVHTRSGNGSAFSDVERRNLVAEIDHSGKRARTVNHRVAHSDPCVFKPEVRYETHDVLHVVVLPPVLIALPNSGAHSLYLPRSRESTTM